MAIKVDEKKRIFFLETENSMYQMKADAFGVLKHIWYGEKTGMDMEYLLEYPDMGFSGNIYEAGNQRNYSLDTLPQEYAAQGVGDYRITAAAAVHEDGSYAVDFRYQGYEIKQGKYKIDGLPAVYAGEDESETLEVTLMDTASGLKVILKYGVLSKLDVITRSAVFVNSGDEAVTLTKAHSLCLDIPGGDWEWIHFHGRHAMERLPERSPILHGIQESGSTRGTSSHHQNPAVLLCEAGCTETRGACIGAALMYSGSFQAQVERDQTEHVRLTMGIHPELFSWKLKKGKNFSTPEVILSYSSEGIGSLSRQFHKVIREHVCRGVYKTAERPVLINNWEATYFDFDQEKILRIAGEAARLGIDMLVLDDGWFGNRDSDESGLGDWVVNEEKLKGGLNALVERVNGLGLKFGLWFEPEMVSEDSELYRNHPGWAIQIPGRKPNRSRCQLVLDMTRKDVCDYLYEKISGILKSTNIEYVKWDMNRSICDWYSALLPAEGQKEMPHRYILGLYELLERLTGEFPNVLFEGCSGGGGRFDAGMLYYCPQIWCSDDTDCYERVNIQYGTSFFYPVSAVGSHISAVPNHQTGRITSIEARAVTAMAGSFGYELDLNILSEEEKQSVKDQIKKFKQYGPLIRNGSYYRLSDPIKENTGIWSFVSEDKRKVLVQGMIFRTKPNMVRYALRLSGLEPDLSYRLMENGKCYTGNALMEGGILLPAPWGDYVPVELCFETVQV